MKQYTRVVRKTDGTYTFDEVLINETAIVNVVADTKAQLALSEGKFPEGLSPHASFSKITLMNGAQYTVVGSISDISHSISKSIIHG